VARERESDRNGRVYVRAGQVSCGVDHGHDDQSEHEAYTDSAERVLVASVGHDCPATRKDEGERRQPLGRGTTPEIGPAIDCLRRHDAILRIDKSQFNRYL
jgi:hypothetical protein